MNYDVAMQWADALESGKFKQGRGELESSSGACCVLGVLCKIAPLELIPAYQLSGSGRILGALLPNNVKSWAGTQSFTGALGREVPVSGIIGQTLERVFSRDGVNTRGSLLALNDSGGWSFRKLAKFIRKNWRSL